MKEPTTDVLTAHWAENLLYYSFPALDALSFVRHGFSTRLGGVSTGIYESMNLSYTRGDDFGCVTENFRRLCAVIGVSADKVVISAQEHHTLIYNVTDADTQKKPSLTDVDGLLTNVPGAVLCTQYADCVPLLFADPVKKVVGTAHAGWKGTVAQIGACMVQRMREDYGCVPEDIYAAIAPSIGACCFEVDTPVYEAFCTVPVFDDTCVEKRENHKYYLDLWETNRRILLAAGLCAAHISVTDLCTRCHPTVFWSHRATGGQRGSLAALIAIG